MEDARTAHGPNLGAVKRLAGLFVMAGGHMRVLLLSVAFACFGVAFAQSGAPLHLEKEIALHDVSGRIDHMSFDPKTQRLFVAALGNDTLEIVDTRRGRRLHTIRGLDEPQGVLYLPSANRLYVANGGNGTVEIFDGTSYRLLKTLKLGSDADNIRFDTALRQIYIGYGSGALASIDADGKKTSVIQLDAHPESFQMEANSHRIFVNLPDARTLAVIDKHTGRIVANWKTGGALANFPMALDEGQHRLFVVCRRPAKLIVLDTNSGNVVATLPAVGDCDDLFYDSRAHRLYASGGEGSVWVFQQQSPNRYAEMAKIPTRRGARTSLFSPDADRLYVAARQQGSAPAIIYVYRVRR